MLFRSSGALWAGTLGGASRFDGQHFENVTREDGLPNGRVTDVLADMIDTNWFGTVAGLVRRNGTPPVAAVAAVGNGSSGHSPDPVETRIWSDGVDLLAKANMNERQSRPLLGRWCKDYGREAVAMAIAACQAVNTPDPKAYIVGCLQKRGASAAGVHVGRSEYADAEDVPPCDDCRNVPIEGAEFAWQVRPEPCEKHRAAIGPVT